MKRRNLLKYVGLSGAAAAAGQLPGLARNTGTARAAEASAVPSFTAQPNPWGALWPEPPFHFLGVKSVQLVARAPAGMLQKIAPFPLKCESDLFVTMWALVGNCIGMDGKDTHQYKNWRLIDVAIPVSYKGLKGMHSTIDFEDLGMGVSVGRELWGYPKKPGSFVWKETDDGFDLKAMAEGGAVVAESTIKLDPKGAPERKATAPVQALREYLDGPALMVLNARPAGSIKANRADVIQIPTTPLPNPGGVANWARGGTGTLKFYDRPLNPLASTLGPVEILDVQVAYYSFKFPIGEFVGSEVIAGA